jgi:glutamate synthase (NADPH) small chain
VGKVTGFLETARVDPGKVSVGERVRSWREVERRLPIVEVRAQASRCMDCGVPFCHGACPLGNAIPDWNDHAYRGRDDEASAALHATNNFPEVTGRICPAPCESACVLNLARSPVSIRAIERAVADEGIASGSALRPVTPSRRTGRRIAVVGSGPAGLACAQQLARAGHDVTVLERDDRLGGLLRYGIPDFKLEKAIVDARVAQMRAEGVSFRTGVSLGRDVSLDALRATHDAVALCVGASVARELDVPGRTLDGVHLAMSFLTQQNRVVAGDALGAQVRAEGRHVVVLGGGDTGADCVGTSHRQGAATVTQIELMPRPPEGRDPSNPWPRWPMILRTSTSHEEGGTRAWALRTLRLVGDEHGHVRALEAERVALVEDAAGAVSLRAVEGERVELACDLVLLAMGFTGAEPASLGAAVPTRRDGADFATNLPGVYVCGDARRGASLVVWAIWEGREAARAIDRDLMGDSGLPTAPLRGVV